MYVLRLKRLRLPEELRWHFSRWKWKEDLSGRVRRQTWVVLFAGCWTSLMARCVEKRGGLGAAVLVRLRVEAILRDMSDVAQRWLVDACGEDVGRSRDEGGESHGQVMRISRFIPTRCVVCCLHIFALCGASLLGQFATAT